MASTAYIADIGIESHVQLKTASKLFCGCGNDARGAEPNTLVCPVCLGMPGTLPVLNKRAVELAILAGLALNAEIATETKFDRKNYFYPDLPKGYQITQFDRPIVGSGLIEVASGDERFEVRLTRAHLEEDAGKLTHPEGADYSLVDLNRAGTPLLEIVSEPDMHSPAQAKAYAQELYDRVRYSGVSDADLYHGNMRFDLNISVRPADSKRLGVRTEIKNLNSFRSIERAATYEIERQIAVYKKGKTVTQETRGWDEARTYPMRSKEEAADYRYFPEPDLPPLVITTSMQEEVKKTAPPTVNEIRQRLSDAKLSGTQIQAILGEPRLARLQLEVLTAGPEQALRSAGWLAGEVLRLTSHENFDWEGFQLNAEDLIGLASMVEDNLLSSSGAKQVLGELCVSSENPQQVAERLNVLQLSDSDELGTVVDEVIADNSKAADDVRKGEVRAIGFLVGQVMKRSGGQANPQMVQKILKERLKSE